MLQIKFHQEAWNLWPQCSMASINDLLPNIMSKGFKKYVQTSTSSHKNNQIFAQKIQSNMPKNNITSPKQPRTLKGVMGQKKQILSNIQKGNYFIQPSVQSSKSAHPSQTKNPHHSSIKTGSKVPTVYELNQRGSSG